MADSSRVQVYYLEEATWGVTPGTALNTLRGVTSESLKGAANNIQSQELRADRQIPDLVRTEFRAEGELNCELSFGSLDDLFEGAFFNDFVTNALVNGSVFKSYTLEKQFSDIGQFVSYTGMVVDRLALTIRPGEIVTARLGFLGKDETIAATSVGTGAPIAAPTATPMNAVDDVSLIEEGGSAVDLQALEIELANNLRTRPQIGSVTTAGVGTGRCVVTGRLEAYFESPLLYQKWLQQTESSLAVTLDDGTNTYALTIPRVRYSDGQVLAEGIDQDVLIRLPFTALLNSGTGTTIELVRSV